MTLSVTHAANWLTQFMWKWFFRQCLRVRHFIDLFYSVFGNNILTTVVQKNADIKKPNLVSFFPFFVKRPNLDFDVFVMGF